jgi:hypothetical protein
MLKEKKATLFGCYFIWHILVVVSGPEYDRLFKL